MKPTTYCPVMYMTTRQRGTTLECILLLPLASWVGWLETGVLFFAN